MIAPLLNAQQAGELLGVPHTWLLQEARAERIPHVRLGRYVRFSADDLLAWCDARTRGPRPRSATRPSLEDREHHNEGAPWDER